MKLRKALAAAAVPVAGIGIVAAAPVEAHAHYYGYHILNYNGPAPDYNVYIYSEPGCIGERHTLAPGAKAVTHGWDSFRMTADYFNVKVYDGTTGAKLADRDYLPGTCVRAYPQNDYRVSDF